MSDRDVECQIDGFLARYAPPIEALLREARSRVRELFPRGHELVYDNYNALVFAISPSGRTPDCFLSVTGYPRWVTLFFAHGNELDDPQGLLEGEGKHIRGVRLVQAADFDATALRALIDQAVRLRQAALDQAPPLATTIKGVSAKQRPRR